jgi:hypothetical protein
LDKSLDLKYQFGGKTFVAAMKGSEWKNSFSIVKIF